MTLQVLLAKTTISHSATNHFNHKASVCI